jgi:hypothetical protein
MPCLSCPFEPCRAREEEARPRALVTPSIEPPGGDRSRALHQRRRSRSSARAPGRRLARSQRPDDGHWQQTSGRHGRRRGLASDLGSCGDRKGSNVGVEPTSRAGLQLRARMPPKRQARRGVELGANDRNPRGRRLIARRVSLPLLSCDTPAEGREVLSSGSARASERRHTVGRAEAGRDYSGRDSTVAET